MAHDGHLSEDRDMKILLAVDGTPASLAAVRAALGLRSRGLKAEFVLVNVQPPPSLYEVVTAHDQDRLTEMRRTAGADLLAAAETLLRDAGAEWEEEVAGGEAAALIVELAENYGCDLIALGRGETAASVALHAPMPVLQVPPPAPDDEG